MDTTRADAAPDKVPADPPECENRDPEGQSGDLPLPQSEDPADRARQIRELVLRALL